MDCGLAFGDALVDFRAGAALRFAVCCPGDVECESGEEEEEEEDEEDDEDRDLPLDVGLGVTRPPIHSTINISTSCTAPLKLLNIILGPIPAAETRPTIEFAE